MTIILVGGGSGGHIVPLVAVAKELKKTDSTLKIVAICERNAKFAHVLEDSKDIDKVYQVRSGKFRRYPGDRWWQKLMDYKTFFLNGRDAFYVIKGYREAKKLLRQLKPAGMLFKGGYVGVPVGLAAGHLKIPFITHDSDTQPGLTNRIIGRWAAIHATGMPKEFYSYPSEKTVFTGTPISNKYTPVNKQEKLELRSCIGLKTCDPVILVIGGSQGAKTLNDSFQSIAPRLMQHNKHIGIIHNAGNEHVESVKRHYANDLLANERRNIIVIGFTEDMQRYSGAADLVVTRSSATFIAEFAAQGIACIAVPGNLASNHQLTNAKHLESMGAVVLVSDEDSESLYDRIQQLLISKSERDRLAANLHKLAKPGAAKELADLVIKTFKINET